MEFLRFCIADCDQLRLVLVEDVGCDVGLGAECEVEDLVELGLGHFLAEEVDEFVDSDPVPNCRAGRKHGLYLCVPVADRNVFENIALV